MKLSKEDKKIMNYIIDTESYQYHMECNYLKSWFGEYIYPKLFALSLLAFLAGLFLYKKYDMPLEYFICVSIIFGLVVVGNFIVSIYKSSIYKTDNFGMGIITDKIVQGENRSQVVYYMIQTKFGRVIEAFPAMSKSEDWLNDIVPGIEVGFWREGGEKGNYFFIKMWD